MIDCCGYVSVLNNERTWTSDDYSNWIRFKSEIWNYNEFRNGLKKKNDLLDAKFKLQQFDQVLDNDNNEYDGINTFKVFYE